MLGGLVGVVGRKVGLQVFGGHLPRVLGDGQHLVPREFDGTCLVGGDVTRHGGHHALVAVEQRVDDDLIGLGTAREEPHVSLGASAGGADLLSGRGGVLVGAVARLLDQVGLYESLKDGGMRALHVIAGEGKHGL